MDPRLAYDTLDIISNEAYRNGPPHELYTLMRREAPVLKHRGIDPGSPAWFWALTRHTDVVEVSRQFQIYSSAKKGALMNQDRPDLEVARMMIDQDPPEHTRLRNLVNRGFTPKAVRMLEDHFRDVAERLIREAVAEGEVDFVDKVSAELPLIAIAELLGVPHEDRRKVFEWSNRMIGATDPDMSGGLDDAAAASIELYMYANELGAQRRAEPRNDLISMLVSAEGNDQLSEHEFDLFVLLLSVAGNETTRNGISHGVLALIDHPHAYAELRADPSLIPERGGGDAPLGHAGQQLRAHRHVRRRAPRRADQGGRRGVHAVRQRQPRRGRLHRPVHLRHPPQPEPARHLRRWRPALLPRVQPGQDGDARPVRAARRPGVDHRAVGRRTQAAQLVRSRHQEAPRSPHRIEALTR
ncbi:MAG: cytochrome P450 [Ilumatobacteraceae bacterium]